MPGNIISAELRARVRELDQARCAYCHTPESLAVTLLEVDHIVPKSAGGETILDNLCLACPPCNRYKGAKQQISVPGTGHKVSLYHPRRQIWAVHFRWSDDKTVLLGVTPVGQVTVTILRINRPQMVRLRGIWNKLGPQYFS